MPEYDLKAGAVVTAFEDPITEKQPEGKVKLLVKCATPDVELDSEYHLECWKVQFEDGVQSYRKIKVSKTKPDLGEIFS